jgi:large subunit ribosomal protein L9
VAAKLNGVSLTLAAKTGTSGKIFGSITALQVANMLKDQGYEVDRRKIMLDDVKTLGSYEATVNLFKDISATVKVEVVAE